MNLNIKKLYKTTVKTLKKHQTEIELALAVAAVVAVEEDAATSDAKEDIKWTYQDLINSYKYHIAELEKAIAE